MSVTVKSKNCGMGSDCGCNNCGGHGLHGLGDFSYFDPSYPSSMPNDPVVTQNGSPIDIFGELWDSLPSASGSWQTFFNSDAASMQAQINAMNPNYGAMNNNAGGAGLWQTILAGTASTFNSIARSRYGVPPPGTLITNGPNGTTVQTLPVGASSGFNLNPLGASGFGGLSLTTLLLMGGAAYLLLKK